jgi:hypothetical protein
MAGNGVLRIMFEPTREGSDMSVDEIAQLSAS